MHWAPNAESDGWTSPQEVVRFLAKVETHNHPTSVSPYAGSATGSGSKIRDRGAVGRGSELRAGLAGFSVSDLLIPGYHRLRELPQFSVGRPIILAVLWILCSRLLSGQQHSIMNLEDRVSWVISRL